MLSWRPQSVHTRKLEQHCPPSFLREQDNSLSRLVRSWQQPVQQALPSPTFSAGTTGVFATAVLGICDVLALTSVLCAYLVVEPHYRDFAKHREFQRG